MVGKSVAWGSLLLCVVVLLYGLIFLSKTLLGFVLVFGSGIIALECGEIIRQAERYKFRLRLDEAGAADVVIKQLREGAITSDVVIKQMIRGGFTPDAVIQRIIQEPITRDEMRAILDKCEELKHKRKRNILLTSAVLAILTVALSLFSLVLINLSTEIILIFGVGAFVITIWKIISGGISPDLLAKFGGRK